MKRVVLAAFLALMSLICVVQTQNAAPAKGPSVSGTFQISSDVGLTRYLEFYAWMEKNGNTTGETVFMDQPSASDPKVVNTESSQSESATAFFAKAEFDCMVINGNKAVMSGRVTTSSLERYVGQRFVLAVQDGDNSNPPRKDKLTFGFYRETSKGWLPLDSERSEEGTGPMSWITQDSEREDDTPVLSPKSGPVGCQSFPISSFSFVDEQHGRGSIQVRP